MGQNREQRERARPEIAPSLMARRMGRLLDQSVDARDEQQNAANEEEVVDRPHMTPGKSYAPAGLSLP